MKRDVLIVWSVLSLLLVPAAAAAAQEPPPPPVAEPVSAQRTTPPAAEPGTAADPQLRPLSGEELDERRSAIFVMEGALINAVKNAARITAEELRRVQPGLMMFSSAPVKAHGLYLDDYGVLYQVEIPSVIPSVASLVETLGRNALNRERQGRANAAQPTALSDGLSDAVMDPDAHYVASVKAQLIMAMVQYSHSLALRPGELLVVSARDASEVPGQVAPPSTMTLSVKAADLADFRAGRLTVDEIRRRVTVRPY